MNELIARLRQCKLVQWVLAYIAAARFKAVLTRLGLPYPSAAPSPP